MNYSLTARVAPAVCALLGREHKRCGNTACEMHIPLWRGFRSPALRANGAWFCSSSCLAQRIFLDCARAPQSRPHAARMPLGMILLAQGVVREPDLRLALTAQRDTGERIGVQLARCGLASSRQITAALAAQWQCPAIEDLAQVTAHPSSIPLSVMRDCRMVPISAPGESIIRIMFDGPIDHGALYAVERMLGCRTVPCVGSAMLLEEVLCRAADQARDMEVNFGDADRDAIARTATSYAEELSGGEIRYVSFGGRFWLRIPRPTGAVNVVFTETSRPRMSVPHS